MRTSTSVSTQVQLTAKQLTVARKTHKITQRMATKLWEILFNKPISQTHICRFEKLQLTDKNLTDLQPEMAIFVKNIGRLMEENGSVRKARKQHKKFIRGPNKVKREKNLENSQKTKAVVSSSASIPSVKSEIMSEDYNLSESSNDFNDSMNSCSTFYYQEQCYYNNNQQHQPSLDLILDTPLFNQSCYNSGLVPDPLESAYSFEIEDRCRGLEFNFCFEEPEVEFDF